MPTPRRLQSNGLRAARNTSAAPIFAVAGKAPHLRGVVSYGLAEQSGVAKVQGRLSRAGPRIEPSYFHHSINLVDEAAGGKAVYRAL